MRKVILTLTLIATLGIVACSSDKKKAHENEHSEKMAKTEYHCPMECEGDKTYTDKNVKCPVCKMKLVEVDKSIDHEKMKEHDSVQDHDSENDKKEELNKESSEH